MPADATKTVKSRNGGDTKPTGNEINVLVTADQSKLPGPSILKNAKNGQNKQQQQQQLKTGAATHQSSPECSPTKQPLIKPDSKTDVSRTNKTTK